MYAPFPSGRRSRQPGAGHDRPSRTPAPSARALDKLDRAVTPGLHCVGQDIATARRGDAPPRRACKRQATPTASSTAPLNEPLHASAPPPAWRMNEGLMGLPEVQFGDYSLNAFHWLVYLGTHALVDARSTPASKLVLRMPTDPFGGGAMYHSMSPRRVLLLHPRPGRHHAVHLLRRARAAAHRRGVRRSRGVPRAEVDVPTDARSGLPGRVRATPKEHQRAFKKAHHARRGPRPARRRRSPSAKAAIRRLW